MDKAGRMRGQCKLELGIRSEKEYAFLKKIVVIQERYNLGQASKRTFEYKIN